MKVKGDLEKLKDGRDRNGVCNDERSFAKLNCNSTHWANQQDILQSQSTSRFVLAGMLKANNCCKGYCIKAICRLVIKPFYKQLRKIFVSGFCKGLSKSEITK